VKELSKNRDIWVRVLFSSLCGREGFGLVWLPAHFLVSGSGEVRFLVNPGFWFGSFLLGSLPSLVMTLEYCNRNTPDKHRNVFYTT